MTDSQSSKPRSEAMGDAYEDEGPDVGEGVASEIAEDDPALPWDSTTEGPHADAGSGPPPAGALPDSVYLSEVTWRTVDDPSDWIEVVNGSDAPRSLAGWVLRDEGDSMYLYYVGSGEQAIGVARLVPD